MLLLRVEVRQRLVHEERLRQPHDRAPECDTLLLAARKVFRPPRQDAVNPQPRSGLSDGAIDLKPGSLPAP
jgi:hypothetical protein